MIFGSNDETDDSTEESAESDDMLSSEPAHANDGGPEVSSGNTSDQELQEVETRLNDMEADLEQTSASVRSIEGKQDDLSEEVEQLNDRIRQLLGVYDQAAADANPFTGESDGEDSNGFGVVGNPETHSDLDESDDGSDGLETSESLEANEDGRNSDAGTSEERTPGTETNTQETEHLERSPGEETAAEQSDDSTHAASPEEGLTFEELKAQTTNEAQTLPEDHDTVGDNHEETQSGRGVVEDEQLGGTGDHGWNSDLSQADVPDTGNETLETVPQTYAADIIVMDWVSMLIRRSGPAGALKSFEYYESVEWISSSVREYLETILSGPGIDAHIEPDSPHEPRSVDHLESYTYIEQLDKLRRVD